MKKITYIFLFVVLSLPLYGQLGIGTDKPQGKLDINQKDNKNRMGLVLPIVEKVDVDSIYTKIDADDNESDLVIIPSVTTFDHPFQTITISDTDETGQINTEEMRVPSDEAPEGTIVYDASLGCIRAKKSASLGDWTDCLVDSQLVNDEINYDVYGGQDFKIKKMSAGYYFSVAIGADNKAVYTAGRGSYYRTGQGRTGNTPWTNIIGKPAVDVSAGYQHGAAVLEDGSLYTWGNNNSGETCQGTSSGNTRAPKKVIMPTNSNVIRVEAGYRNTLILTEDGKVYACGRNSNGLNANGITGGVQKTPVEVDGLDGVMIKDISLAARAAAVLSEDGKIYTWGSNESYRTGLGTSSGNTLIPTIPPGLEASGKAFKNVAIGIGNGIAVTTDDRIYVWGNRALGTTSRNKPTLVSPGELTRDSDESVVAVAVARHKNSSSSGSATMVITDKSVYATGRNIAGRRNNFGRLGIVDSETGSIIESQNGSFLEAESHAFFSGKPFTGVSIGYNHALISTGESADNPSASYLGYGSGYNNYRQLGTTANRKVYMSLKK